MRRKFLGDDELRRLVYGNKTGRLMNISAMPLLIDYLSPDAGALIEVVRVGDSFVQTTALAKAASPRKGLLLDPWKLREAFEKVKDANEIAAFLSICGPFHAEKLPQEITLSQFETCKAFIDNVREQVAVQAWPDFISPEGLERIWEQPEITFETRKGRGTPRMIATPRTALEVIGTTLFVDRLEAKKVGRCGWHACKRLFYIETAKEKRFCCTEHSRLEWKRLEREQLSKAKKEAKRAKTSGSR